MRRARGGVERGDGRGEVGGPLGRPEAGAPAGLDEAAHAAAQALGAQRLGARREVGAVRRQRAGERLDAPVLPRRGAGHRNRPVRLGPQVEHLAERAHEQPGLRVVVFVDAEHARDLHQAGLHRLHGVAALGHQDDERRVGRLGHVELALPHADRLQQDDVVARRVEHVDGRLGGEGEAAERAARGQAADEHAVVVGAVGQAHAVPEQRPPRERTRRVHGHDRHRLAGRPEVPHQAVGEGALARARRPGDADAPGAPGVRVERVGERLGAGEAVLDRRQRARDGPAAAGEHVGGEGEGGHG